MKRLFAALATTTLLSHVAHAGELTLYERHGFRGNEVTLRNDASDFRDFGFNDRVSSIVVHSGAWEVCEHKNFGGHCAVFRRGEYARLEGFNNSISSAREVQMRGGWRDRDGDGRDDRREGWNEGAREGRDDWRDGDRGGRRDDTRRWGGQREAVVLYAGQGFEGRAVGINGDVRTLNDASFNDRAGSLIIREGTWQLCEHADFRGQCLVFGPGRYEYLEGLNNRLSSLRRVR
ncbi:beta/gamma crystallin-related protein [[Empedobacter] haloabium]|uniref:Beta/gamma crystallin-related protein n=1 Tax=[Empedobacter] haloabium TaxID=592317 RepID=A0ABZ1UPT7_9BURK